LLALRTGFSGQHLFQYLDGEGARPVVSSQDVNGYIRETIGTDFSSKHFRTWAGTMHAASLLAAEARLANNGCSIWPDQLDDHPNVVFGHVCFAPERSDFFCRGRLGFQAFQSYAYAKVGHNAKNPPLRERRWVLSFSTWRASWVN
jgi:hypothetical protein